ncbi:hypothetical protein H9P43_001874 [Blastocladiella emersonii ATCC 22665]|nr:hypothetical protein H9P43_001874 [Blastocladiella emersonii ATCC 22665]
MVGVLLQKLELEHVGEAERQRERDKLGTLFQLALLKLALFLYHPDEPAKRIRYRRQLPHAADLRSHFIFRQDSSDGVVSSSSSSTGNLSRSASSVSASRNKSPHTRLNRSQSPHSPLMRARSPPVDGGGGGSQVLAAGRLSPRPSADSLRDATTEYHGAAPPPPPMPTTSAAASWLRAHLPRTLGLLDRISPVDERDNWFARSPPQAAADGPDGVERTRSQSNASRLSTDDGGVLSESETEDVEDDLDELDPDETDLGNHLHYRLEELIGQGAVGLVYLATLTPPAPAKPVQVATKHFHLPSANPHLNRRNFEQLIGAMALSDHPNVLSYYGSHLMDEDCFLFMEYCDGGTLAEWVRANGPLRDMRILSFWIRQLVHGLEFLHRHGIVHRDVKPANIMIREGILKHADFSSAKIYGLCCRKVHDARVVGTPSYLAPEVVAGNQTMEIKGAQDIWSLGCVIYEMLLAKPPFSEIDNVWSLYFMLGQYSTINSPPQPPSSRLRRLLDYISGAGRDSTSSSSSDNLTLPAQSAGPPSPLLAPKSESALDTTTATSETNQSGGFGALLGNRKSIGPHYRYAAKDAVVVESAPPEGLVTPLEEVADPLANLASSSLAASIPSTPRTSFLSTRRPINLNGVVGADGEPGPEQPRGDEEVGYVTGTDAMGYLQYKFMEPLFPMVPNHHPLLSQLCQVGSVDPLVLDLVQRCLEWDPRRRATAAQLLTLEPLHLEQRLAPLMQLTQLLGPRKSALLAALATVAVVSGHIWWKMFRVPPHLRHLPRIPIRKTIHYLTSGEGFLNWRPEMMKLLREDALRRGAIKSMNETPRMWLTWMFGRWTVVVANPEDSKLLLTGHEQFEKMDATKMPNQVSRAFLGQNVAMTRTPNWKRQRKVVNPAFRRGWATSIFGPPARSLLEQFDKLEAGGTTVNVSDWMTRMTLDALSQAAFGTNFGSIENPNTPMVETYHAVMKDMLNPKFILLAPINKFLPSYARFAKSVDEFNKFIYSLIDAKAAEAAKRRAAGVDDSGDDDDAKDLLELMVTASESGGFSREELRANTIVFFIAGHDTTANALTFVLYSLGMNPEIQRKARAEVLAVMGDADKGMAAGDFPFPTNDEQAQMPYLTAIIKETMRLYPSVPAMPMRELMEPVTLSSGLHLGTGSFVASDVHAVQTASEYWGDDAEKFKPERFLANEDKVMAMNPSAHDFKWVPFGGGQRICLGQQFSIVEQRVILSMLLLRYEWTVTGNKAALAGVPDTTPSGNLLHATGIEIKLNSCLETLSTTISAPPVVPIQLSWQQPQDHHHHPGPAATPAVVPQLQWQQLQNDKPSPPPLNKTESEMSEMSFPPIVLSSVPLASLKQRKYREIMTQAKRWVRYHCSRGSSSAVVGPTSLTASKGSELGSDQTLVGAECPDPKAKYFFSPRSPKWSALKRRCAAVFRPAAAVKAC